METFWTRLRLKDHDDPSDDNTNSTEWGEDAKEHHGLSNKGVVASFSFAHEVGAASSLGQGRNRSVRRALGSAVAGSSIGNVRRHVESSGRAMLLCLSSCQWRSVFE